MVLKQQLKQNKQRAKIMRKIFASEFMTIDGVIQNEEADGDGFKYGGWFFPNADEVTGAVARAASKARRSAVRTQDLRRMGNVLADPFKLLAEMAGFTAFQRALRKLSRDARNLWEILTLCPNKISFNDRMAPVSC